MAAFERRELNYGEVVLNTEKTLGIGSYGKVCKAMCGQLPCAAKILHETLFQHGDPGEHNLIEQFDKECRFLSTIHHPNIVQYLQTVREPGSPRSVLLMELMDESLTNFLKRSATPPLYCVQIGICHDISLALSYLHQNEIIHRDLSSNNILLTAGKRAKVTDFGMSKYIDRMTTLTKVPGAEVYMPPEAKTTPPHYSTKLDCFSFGVLVIQIATKNFPAPTKGSIMVDDPNYPTGQVAAFVPERERRKADIDKIKQDHPLRQTALDCISDRHTERPTSSIICERLTLIKKKSKMAEEENTLTTKLLEQKVTRISNKNSLLEEKLEGLQRQHQHETRELRKRWEFSEKRATDLNRQLQQTNQENHHLRQELETKKREIGQWKRSEEGLKNRLEQAQRERERVQIDMGNRLMEAQQEGKKLRTDLDKSRLDLKQKDEEIQRLKRQLNAPAPQPHHGVYAGTHAKMERAPEKALPFRATTSSPQQSSHTYSNEAGMVRRASDERVDRRPHTHAFHPSPPPTTQLRVPSADRLWERPAQSNLGPTQHRHSPPVAASRHHDRSPTEAFGTNRQPGMAASRHHDKSPTGFVYGTGRQPGMAAGNRSSPTNIASGSERQLGGQVRQQYVSQQVPRSHGVEKVEERQQWAPQSQQDYPYNPRQNLPLAQPPPSSGPYQPVQRAYSTQPHPSYSQPHTPSSQPHPSSSQPRPSSSQPQVRRASVPDPQQAPVPKSESVVKKSEIDAKIQKPEQWKSRDPAKEQMTRYDGQVTVHQHRQVLYFTQNYTPYEYHLEQDRWVELPRCDNKKFAVCFVDDKLTVIGGLDSKDNNSNAVLYRHYKEWKSDLKNLPFMAIARAHPAVLTTPTHLIVAGGAYVERNYYSGYDSIEIFNLNTRVWWTATTKLPMAIRYPQLLHTENISRMMLYDIETNLLFSTSLEAMLQQEGGAAGWLKKDPVPHVKEGSSLVTVGDSLLAIGGKNEAGQACQEIYIFDKIEGGWSRVKDMGTPRYWALTAVTLNNVLVVVGGFKGGEKEACTLTETIAADFV